MDNRQAGSHHHDHGEEPFSEDLSEGASEFWNPDDISLLTVGMDVGSSTSHLMFSRLHLRRLGKSMSSRYVVVSRELVYRSPIHLTPYRDDFTIDAEVLRAHVREAFEAAALSPAQVDTGAVILTGEAIRRVNARAIAELFATDTGRFVCATAGHHLEAILSAHGSGAVETSRATGDAVLNVDVGGGTSKLALIRAGEIVETAAVNVGGRLVAFSDSGLITRVEPAARLVGEHLGIHLERGDVLEPKRLESLAEALASVLLNAMAGGRPAEWCQDLWLTEALGPAVQFDRLTFSGGVAEYLYGRESRDFGDLARYLAVALMKRVPAAPAVLPEGIRATVIGASQHTVQVSGDTLSMTDAELLPLHNLPVVYVSLAPGVDPDPDAMAQAIADAHMRLDLEPGSQMVALSVDWHGAPSHRNLRRLGEGIRRGLAAGIEAGLPIILVFREDVAKLVGDLMRNELGVAGPLVSIDSVDLRELDFIDIGQLIEERRVVPVVVKSLLFPQAAHGAELISSKER